MGTCPGVLFLVSDVGFTILKFIIAMLDRITYVVSPLLSWQKTESKVCESSTNLVVVLNVWIITKVVVAVIFRGGFNPAPSAKLL